MMLMNSIKVILVVTLILISGCSCRQYAEREVCLRDEIEELKTPCVTQIDYLIPYNYTKDINVEIDSNPIECGDIKITTIESDVSNVTFNKTIELKMVKARVCVESEVRNVCVS